MQVVLPKSHPIFASADDIRQLCAPLKATFSISHFAFVRIYPDLSRTHISTSPEWVEYFYKKMHFYYQQDGLAEASHWQSSFTILQELGDKACIQDACDHDIWNGVLIAEHDNQITELSFFAFPRECSTNSMPILKLINHIDELKQFVNSFKNESSKLLIQAERNKIVLPFLKSLPSYPIKTLYGEQPFEQMSLLRRRQLFRLTNKESQCCDLLSLGYSIQEIGNQWCRSRRTVEKHLDNIRRKIGARHMYDLIRWLHESK